MTKRSEMHLALSWIDLPGNLTMAGQPSPSATATSNSASGTGPFGTAACVIYFSRRSSMSEMRIFTGPATTPNEWVSGVINPTVITLVRGLRIEQMLYDLEAIR
jgi:hypothetical protein